ncbi:MAG: hypothetical protein HFG56_05680 [Lachnospiraceae bacterium]|nr:hypothetical protein [Lachnospiraceae bacterium]
MGTISACAVYIIIVGRLMRALRRAGFPVGKPGVDDSPPAFSWCFR